MAVSPAASPNWASGPDIELDTAALRVLAHPMRINVLALLRQCGASTATRVAGELGINPGAASYHLRRLAAGGLIVEEPGRGTGRERWWKAAHRQSIHDPASGTPEQREAGRAYAHAVALACVERLHTAAQEAPLLPDEWFDVSTFGDFVLRLSPKEVARMRDEIFAVISRYRQARGEDSEGLASVAVQVQMFPVPGTIAPRSVGS
ncbi:helix-turn-helix domain-containing protein [Streptomyces sp. NBC_00006]|uniref:winged helix-turn-helix domain-containing protein n=1 Tax=unclassified Streptomyces TaxID=2593676 RepID=UPI0022505007|nr:MULTISPECIES: winged helix-turn-helix domain-containing protein [unclassified Streptomyces]MCX5531046.1 helix-turn-helix domain-containing protein [Streptomyces sp. NBC_00006]